MKKTKIDWCDCTVNPVVGCPNGCEYCYGRVMNSRFGFVPCWDKPEFRPEQLKQFKSKTPKSVFIDSMSDIGTWKDEWLKGVLEAIRSNSQHWYLALTKTDTRRLMDRIMKFQGENQEPLKLFIGKSITMQKQADSLAENKEVTDFLSIERTSGTEDEIPLTIPERLLSDGLEVGDTVTVVGQFRSWNEFEGEKRKLKLAVFVREFLDEHIMNETNVITIKGYVGKNASLRSTPFGRKIIDLLLSVPRQFNKNDHIPVITWGNNAVFADTFQTGEKIALRGRIQSREYNKADENGKVVAMKALEVSVSELSIIDEIEDYGFDLIKEVA